MKYLLLTLLVFIAACTEGNMGNTVVLETSKGNIEIELSDAAPDTADNFRGYVESGFYDGTIFHRVIPGFMVQGGGFTPEGNQKETRAPIALEATGLKNSPGAVAMARTNDPNSATSQFFINTVNNEFLNPAPGNPGYTVFGKVTSGMDVVKAIESSQTTTKDGFADWPVEDVVITKAYIK